VIGLATGAGAVVSCRHRLIREIEGKGEVRRRKSKENVNDNVTVDVSDEGLDGVVGRGLGGRRSCDAQGVL
jgi:hypothetical protein